MPKYDGLLERAKVAYSDLLLHAPNAQTPNHLKLYECSRRLRGMIDKLGEQNDTGFGKRLRQSLFVTQEDIRNDQLAANVSELLDQIDFCLKCRCADCVKIADKCDCEGCLLGGKTVSCNGSSVTREFEPGAISIDGLSLRRMETTRNPPVTHSALLEDANGVRHTDRLDLRTGSRIPG